MLRIASLVLIAMALSGCFRLDSEGPASDAANRLVDLVIDRPKPPMRAIDPVYCYRTLAVVDCAAEPVQGEERRLVGQVGPRQR
jgi:hypothetical protein